MEREFDSELIGEEITFNSYWSSTPRNPDAPVDEDARWQSNGNEENPATVTMKRTNNIQTKITFQKDAIVAANSMRIRYNMNDVISSEG